MKTVLKLIIRFFAAIGVLVVLAIVLGIMKSNGFLGHSGTFDLIDDNSDDRLSYLEWMSFYSNHTHSLTQCGRADFYQSDCDLDDSLTW